MRVALVTGGLNLGGSTTFLCNLAGELIRRGIPTTVLSFEIDNPLATDFDRQKIPVICFNQNRLIFEDRMQLALEELRRFKPTVVLSTLGTASFEVQRYMPAGIFRAGVAQADAPEIYPGIGRYAAHLDMVGAVSVDMKKKMTAQPELAGLPVHYLPYGVPMSGHLRGVSGGGIPQPLKILFLGRFYREQKRVHLFPQILGQLKSSGIPFHWTIAGAGPEQAALEQTMKSAPEQTVSFPGKISYAQVPEILRAHDIYLLASEYEGLPLSLLEAMGAGLVPVVSDLPSGIPEVVDGTNGMLVPVDDVAGYARAIVHLHGHRDELVAKSAAARVRVKTEFSVEAMTNRWLSLFPKDNPAVADWPENWKIQTPLPAQHPVYFSPPMRVIRRLAAKFRRQAPPVFAPGSSSRA